MEVKITFDEVNVRDTQKINDIDIVMVKGEKGDVGYPTDAQVETAVDEWLTAHPEATTTVQDGSITIPKLADDVKNEFDKKADAIVKSASGEVASFSDGGNGLLVKSLNVNIVPKQSGSGDPSPSNVRPISGWNEVNVTRAGKNLLDPAYRYETSASGNYHIHYYWGGGSTTFNEKLLVKAGVTYTFSFAGTNASGIYINKSGGGNIGAKYNSTFITFTPTEDCYIAPDIYWANEPSGGVASINPILSVGSTATAYEPYNGTSYPISLGQTVYGGVLDVVSGKLTIDKGYVDSGALNWVDLSSPERSVFRTNPRQAIQNFKYPTDESLPADAICEVYKGVGYGPITPTTMDNVFAISSAYNQRLVIIDKRFTTTEAFAEYISGKHIVYELATPTTIQLTPQEVTTLLGNNNIWSDSGIVEVGYRADTTLAYNELLAMILENIGN